MALLLSVKDCLKQVQENPYIEGVSRGVLAGVIFMSAVTITDEILSGIIIGGLAALCAEECLAEKFHNEERAQWPIWAGMGVGFVVGLGGVFLTGL